MVELFLICIRTLVLMIALNFIINIWLMHSANFALNSILVVLIALQLRLVEHVMIIMCSIMIAAWITFPTVTIITLVLRRLAAQLRTVKHARVWLVIAQVVSQKICRGMTVLIIVMMDMLM